METLLELQKHFMCSRCLNICRKASSTATKFLMFRLTLFVRLTLVWILLVSYFVNPGSCWIHHSTPNSAVVIRREDQGIQWFQRRTNVSERFQVILIEHGHVLIGARNHLYNVSLQTLEENQRYRISWKPSFSDQEVCLRKKKTIEECQNYVRVVLRKEDGSLLVCGTNSFKPVCRGYIQDSKSLSLVTEEAGVGKCPLDPNHNSTFTYSDGRLYAGTVVDFIGQNYLIYSDSDLVTQQKDSRLLNHPNFVKSFSYQDKIYFFFREVAVEHTNCGKTIFSRVARVCKKDKGGSVLLSDSFTSFFKSRLNCSLPGDFPFYFDEIESVSDVGQGNFMSTYNSGNRTDMIYATFNTPLNSIAGSAVCAFRLADIIETFKGKFKGQQRPHHNWLPVPEALTPSPHPQQCTEHSDQLSPNTLDFIKSHPLMDRAVPAFGAAPIFVQTGINYRFTAVTVDWQVLASNNRYYDVVFIGTDNGHVLKVVNKGRGSQILYNLVEDIVVFSDGRPIMKLHIHRRLEVGVETLVVASPDHLASIPLHRCRTKKTCSACVALQDPYCSWVEPDRKCSNTNQGIQGIQNMGRHSFCTDKDDLKRNKEITYPTPKPTCAPCLCHNKHRTKQRIKVKHREKYGKKDSTDLQRHKTNASTSGEVKAHHTVETLVVSVVVSTFLATVVGFLIGYRISICRNPPQRQQLTFYERVDQHKKTCNKLVDLAGSNNHIGSGDNSPYQPKMVNVSLNLQQSNRPPVTSLHNGNKVYL